MGRKSSAKQVRPDGSGMPPEPTRSFPTLLVVAIVAVVVAAAAVIYFRSDGAPAATETAQAQSAPAEQAVPAVDQKPHPQATLPPLPFSPSGPARPIDTVRDVYRFAAEHPEVLSYVPCYCGCERGGHRGNEDCFVAARDPQTGDVTEWEPHGMT